ncbi:MAG TPA: ABC transporter permease [Nevskiaceae bacterium]|nr:ABC transporter permease [Nevskiaceae bacterium]
MSSRGSIRLAVAGIRGAKGRSLLTMLGVIIGIVSVVTIVGLGEGVKAQVAGQINHFGKDLITIRPGHITTRHSAGSLTNTDLLFGLDSVSGLSTQDVQTVQQAKHIKLAAPLGVVAGTVAADEAKVSPLVLATNASLPDALNQKVPYGSFFEPGDDQANVAVLGQKAARDLFGEMVPLGHKFTFRGQTFIVRGIFDEFDTTPLSPTADFNSAVFIPYQTASKLTNGSMQLYTILAKPDRTGNTAAAISAVNQKLLRAHGGQQDFSVLNQQQTLAASSNILDLLTTLIGGVAAISLLVGGIGIMNIMLVSVTERMHEIGVRKAIGATNRQILSQFVTEATVISVVGGIIGLLLSLLVDLLLHAYTSLKPVVSWRAMAVATGVSIAIGIIFGAAPAIKAARKDPIEALRRE